MEKFHYFIACVELTFVDGEGNTPITRCNTVIKSENGNVPVRLLGKAQQSAFAQLMSKIKDPSIQLLDATFINISALGHMTNDEFHQMPELGDAVVAEIGKN